MRQTKIKVLIALLITMTLVSCKKDISNSLTFPKTLIERETNLWFKSIEQSLSGKVLESTKLKISNLDFSHSVVITNNEVESEIFIIQIKDSDNKFDEYLSFKKDKSEYITVGKLKVIESNYENEIFNITKFFETGTLCKDFRLSIYALNNQHYLTYEGIENSGLKIKKLVNHKNILRSATTTSSLSQSCIDWYIVTTYTYSNGTQYQTEEYLYSTCSGDCEPSDPNLASLECWDQGGGGGLGGSGSGNTADDGKLSCNSFSFTNMTTNMYEAGVSNMSFVMDVAGGAVGIVHNFRPIYVGFPVSTISGNNYTPGQAAAITAHAMNLAGASMSVTYFGMSTTQASIITTAALEIEFKNLTNFYINQEINAAATVSFNQSGTGTITHSAVWNSTLTQLWNGLTGSGCN